MDRISIELTNQCAKACSFCYNGSDSTGKLSWQEDDLVSFVEDCAANGIKAVSFGGGEPLQYPSLFNVFKRLRGKLFRSMTTNGLLLDEALDDVVAAAPNKVHISIHFPQDEREVERVTRQVKALAMRGIKSGVNLLVARSWLDAAELAAKHLNENDISNERIVYLPMRQSDTPTPQEMARVAGGKGFQSMTCLANCAISPRFASLAADKTVAWCSYTTARKELAGLTYKDLTDALDGLGLTFCGGTN
jgi:Predicted Fe-S oxidoreductases